MNRLAEIRKRNGFTQARLARESRVSLAYVQQLEQGGGMAGVDIAEALGRALRVDGELLFPRVPRRASESRQEFFARTFPELAGSLNEVDALRLSMALASMDDNMFQTLCSWNKPMKWDEVIKLAFCFLKAIARRAKLDELMEED
jgi:transcriptional regulator with XRE-family HTH domain